MAAAEDRQRAYTLLVNAYGQARRATTYLRWAENDIEKFAPSLWSGRGGRGNNATACVDERHERRERLGQHADTRALARRAAHGPDVPHAAHHPGISAGGAVRHWPPR